MKNIVVIALMFVSCIVFAQNTSKVEKKGELTKTTYYYDNGQVEQEGTFNKEGKLHGEWTSYDINGNKIAMGSYANGVKVGKWFFWSGDVLKEVNYKDSRVASVQEWKQGTKVALNK